MAFTSAGARIKRLGLYLQNLGEDIRRCQFCKTFGIGTLTLLLRRCSPPASPVLRSRRASPLCKSTHLTQGSTGLWRDLNKSIFADRLDDCVSDTGHDVNLSDDLQEDPRQGRCTNCASSDACGNCFHEVKDDALLDSTRSWMSSLPRWRIQNHHG